MEKELPAGRKIDLDEKVYNPLTLRTYGIVKGCDHDFDSTPWRDEDDYVEYKCTRCGGLIYYEVYD